MWTLFLSASVTNQPRRAKKHLLLPESSPPVALGGGRREAHCGACGSVGQSSATLIKSNRKMERNQWLFLEVIRATNSL